jgi:hypothetical protein
MAAGLRVWYLKKLTDKAQMFPAQSEWEYFIFNE